MHGRYGTTYVERDGHLARIVDRTGHPHAELSWRTEVDAGGGAFDSHDRSPPHLARLVVDGAAVDGARRDHPVLGAVHAVGATAMTALDWARPAEVPAIAEPGRLPLGAGAAILNVIAVMAARAGVASLRYAGPYPTAALWRSLARSFRAPAGVDEAAFTEGALDRALRGARTPIAIDFSPAPHERLAIADGFVELRDGVERAVIHGETFTADGSPARLVARPDGGAACEIWFGDAPYAQVARLAADGALADGPHAIPACTSPVLGREFPLALRMAIGELVAEAVAAPLAADVRALCADTPLVWADLAGRAARETGDGFAVHAALWDRLAPLGLGRLALALAEALAPVLTAAAVRRAST
ncbi:MAG TPA: hypothetical protein VFP84_22910 [Kofleriaceae bacterium]|nr:hypothetical protein [Kofleriaceae bacterium]